MSLEVNQITVLRRVVTIRDGEDRVKYVKFSKRKIRLPRKTKKAYIKKGFRYDLFCCGLWKFQCWPQNLQF
mgnify:CR=1 FL=1